MHHLYLIVLGLFALLLLAGLLLPIAKKLNFPFTVLLAAAGVGLGIITLFIEQPDGGGIAGDFILSIQNLGITSEAVFFLFLPALIFESAMSINIRHLFKDIGPILMLAVVGLLISTFAIGFALDAISGMGFVACLLLGAIVSATDPVAVVAIFKDLGAPKRLTILVEGESLFNDATAIVLFTILAGVVIAGSEASAGGAAIDFIRVFFGGIAVGLIASRAVAWIIGLMRNMPLVEITMTVVLAYLSFLIAEHYLHVSGVMALVTAGLVMGSYGRTKISPKTWHALHETWEQLGFWANSLIFFLVGILVPAVLKDFTITQAIWLVVLLATAFSARAIVLYCLLPIMIRYGLGHHVSNAFRTIMFWGGLRGAVSLALALVIMETAGVDNEIKQFIVVLVTCFVLFTLFVNATTIRFIMAMFGLDKLSNADLLIRNRVMSLSLANVREEMKSFGRSQGIEPKITENFLSEFDLRLHDNAVSAHKVSSLNDSQLKKIGLAILINRERQICYEQFSEGFTSDRITRAVLVNIDTLEDSIKTYGHRGYMIGVCEKLEFDVLFRIAIKLQRSAGYSKMLADRISERFEILMASQSNLAKLEVYANSKIPELLGEELTQKISDILTDRIKLTNQALDALKLQYPEYFQTIQRVHLGRTALRLEDQNYEQMYKDQLIGQDIYNSLISDLDVRQNSLENLPQLDLGLDPEHLVSKVPFLSDLEAEKIKDIVSLLKPQLVLPGEKVCKKGDVGDCMYFISTGAVEVTLENQPVRLGSGEFFGEISLVRSIPRIADVSALTYCQVLILYTKDFKPLMKTIPNLEDTIQRIANERLNSNR